MNCPTCGSPDPAKHPATQLEGEVTYICEDRFHGDTSKLLPTVRNPDNRRGHGTVAERRDF